ncbi:uncharacterized protein [Prorops nasuta]|uniref:uncharacterized protein n=1 Tax=Prorops nasuta TaxID=863751 RepID=UPI0034CE0FC3
MMKLLHANSIACLALIGLVSVVASVHVDIECNKRNCGGPVKYYESLGCSPVYKNPGDCCPVKYNCDHLKARDPNKCYVNGKAYSMGEELKVEDRAPCDMGCTCQNSYLDRGAMSFICAIVDCFDEASPGCYRKHNPDECCGGPQVCPDSPDQIPTCVVNGKTYKDGDYFEHPVDERSCYCGPDFSMEKIDQFCKHANRSYCDPEFNHRSAVQGHCAPVYYYEQSLLSSCNIAYRCQSPKDKIINVSKSTNPEDDTEEMKCRYGDMLLKRGEELNQAVNYDSVCVRCRCDVPPLLSCQRLSNEECDVREHPNFD